MKLKAFIPGKPPTAQGSVNFIARCVGKKVNGRCIPIVQKVKNKGAARWLRVALPMLRARAPAVPFSGPLGVSCLIVLPLQKAKLDLKRDTPRDWAPQRPDRGNVLKIVEDAISDAGWWDDDSLVCETIVHKVRAGKHDVPGVHVTVYKLPPYKQPESRFELRS